MPSPSITHRQRSTPSRPAKVSPISISTLLYLTIIFALFLREGVSREAFLAGATLLVFFLLVFYVIFTLGWNKRFFDSSLTGAQTCAAVVTMLTVFALDRQSQIALNPFLLVVFSQATFRLKPKALVTLSAGSMLTYLLIILLHGMDNLDAFRVDVMTWGATTVALPLVTTMGAKIHTLRQALHFTRHRLAQVEEKAVRDELTGLYNRRQLMAELDAAIVQANSQGSTFCLAVIDVDHFKHINDRHGHLVGDMILREFASVARESIRESDILGRYGGDEFMHILRGTGLKGAVMHAERLRVHTHFLQVHSVMPEKSISLSIGIAQYRLGETAENLIERADAGLYRAKERGRNRVEWIDARLVTV